MSVCCFAERLPSQPHHDEQSDRATWSRAMLKFEGKGTAHTCDGVSRRDFLQAGTLGAMGYTLAQHAQAKEQGLLADGHDDRAPT